VTSPQSDDVDALWIKESEVCDLVDLKDAIRVTFECFRAQYAGHTWIMEKTHAAWGNGHTLHALGGGHGDLVGAKTWAHTGNGATPLLVLWDSASGRLAAVIEAFALGQLRTSAVTGVAIDVLAARDASRLAMIGTGKQALGQVAAALAVRNIQLVSIWSPEEEHRNDFARRIRRAGAACDVEVAHDLISATKDADIVTTATRSREPFLSQDMVSRAVHVNAIGAITRERAEIAADLVAECSIIVADSPTTARMLSSELTGVTEIRSLAEVVSDPPSRPPSRPTLFKAMGAGFADVALGAEALHRARDSGVGATVPQPVRTTPVLLGRPR
jgi:alanine dehydrogenase